jgi:hypothetical protein
MSLQDSLLFLPLFVRSSFFTRVMKLLMLASCGFLLSRLHVRQLLVLLLPYQRHLLWLLLLLLVVRVLVFIVITVDEMYLWRPFATGRRRLRLAILHRVMVLLVLEDLRGVRLVQRHRSCSCYFMTLRPLRRQELLVL